VSGPLRDPETCPGPPEAPFAIPVGHRWFPVAVLGMPGELVNDVPRSDARGIEACPSCRTYRQVQYRRVTESPSPGDSG
jgi:hypothetical protein